MAASMCNAGLVRRKLLLLMKRELEGRQLLVQRLCSNGTTKKHPVQENQVSESSLIAEDDYFGVSIPEEDWTLPRDSSLSKADIFTKYGSNRLTEREKDKLPYVNMPYGTVRFDKISDVKHYKDTRELIYSSSKDSVKEKIMDSMTHVSDKRGVDSSGEKYYISFLDQFKKDSRYRTSGSYKKSTSIARAYMQEQTSVDSSSEKSVESTKNTVTNEHYDNILSRKTSQCDNDQPARMEYGDSISTSSDKGGREKQKNHGRNDSNFIDQQYFQQDAAQANADNPTHVKLNTPKKFNPEEVTPELDPDMMVAHIGTETCWDNAEIFPDQEITPSVVDRQGFTKSHPDHMSLTMNLKQLESVNAKKKSSGRENAERLSNQGIDSSHLEALPQSFPQHQSKQGDLHPEFQNLETTGNKSTKSTEMNFIDQQFFGEYLSEDQSSKNTSVDNDGQDPKSDLNFIDEEYFKETIPISASRTNRVSTLDHRKFEKEKELNSGHRQFEEETIKDVHKFSDIKDMSKKSKMKNNRNDDDNRLHKILQGEVMGRLERAAVMRRRELVKKKKMESENMMDTAYGTVQMLRNEQGRSVQGGAPLRDSGGMKIMKTVVPQLYKMTSLEIIDMITRHILYDKDDIVAIYKPYGLPSHGGPGVDISVAHFMDQISKNLGNRENKLHMIHRLDKETTGVMLLARTKKMAAQLTKAFSKQKVVKKYWAITKGVPSPREGIIDIPMMEGSVDGKRRMVLKPNFLPDGRIATKSSVKTFKAVTHYKVISSYDNTAIVECLPLTGVKHQLRAQLSFGLNTPVLGDHKYSNLLNFAPQKLDSTTLKKLGVQQSKVRHIPLHLHAMSILIPEFLEGRNLFVTSNLPKHFCRSMRNLKLNPSGKY